MPRLSLWRPNHSNDYRFFDRNIFEQFTVGATDIHVHKYIGPVDQGANLSTTAAQMAAGPVLTFANTSGVSVGMYVAGTYIPSNATVISKTSTTVTLSAGSTSIVPAGAVIGFYSDATRPAFSSNNVLNIQDLLFLENRDRKYDTSVYVMRGYYRINDNDFDLTQFGLFLTGDTIFLTVHLNDMVEKMGRKLMVGDVIELPHLKDYYPLNEDLGAALKRYYVVQDSTKSAEGFSPTWWPHLWRVKLQPLVDSQEYKDILNQLPAGDTNKDGVVDGNDSTLGELLSTYNKFIDVNDAIIEQAEKELPYSGYDTSFIYTEPVLDDGRPGNPLAVDASDTIQTDASDGDGTPDASTQTNISPVKVTGYLTGDGTLPNGYTVAAGISFPSGPDVGDFFLRLDYMPNRLFRFDGRRWVKVEDAVRTNLTPGVTNKTLRSTFVNNENVRYKGGLAWDAIRVADPYVPVANAATQSFTLSSKTVVTKVPYNSVYRVKTVLEGITINNTVANTSGNLSFTMSNTLNTGDVLEYTVYQEGIAERQNLSDIFRPTADN